jgi:hypothetical protein
MSRSQAKIDFVSCNKAFPIPLTISQAPAASTSRIPWLFTARMTAKQLDLETTANQASSKWGGLESQQLFREQQRKEDRVTKNRIPCYDRNTPSCDSTGIIG